MVARQMAQNDHSLLRTYWTKYKKKFSDANSPLISPVSHNARASIF